MVRAGAFDDVDIALTWHPHSFWEVAVTPSLANTRADFIFTGRASHAAASPHLGRSALDAVELMNVGVNYMREHMPSATPACIMPCSTPAASRPTWCRPMPGCAIRSAPATCPA